MEIKELISLEVNESYQTLDVTFRIEGDSDDEIREDKVDFNEIKTFGYTFISEIHDFKELLDDDIEDSFIDDGFDDDFDNDYGDIIDEQEVISFLNEYYLIYPGKLPTSELF